MTRQWLADPKLMCKNHYLGEHAETHMFLTKMEKHYSLKGFTAGSMFFGAEFVKQRHDLIASMLSGHKTPLEITEKLKCEYPLIVPDEDDYRKSYLDLWTRCSECKGLHLKEILNA